MHVGSNGIATTTDHSPHSSHLSVHSDVPSETTTANTSVVARTHKQQTTQQVTTVTKVVREVKQLGGSKTNNSIDNQTNDFVTMPLDVHNLGQDVQQLDFVAMPVEMYPRYVMC